MKSETVPLAMPPELLSQVRKAAKLTGLSMADVMRQGIKLGVPKLIEGLSVEGLAPVPENVLRKIYDGMSGEEFAEERKMARASAKPSPGELD